MASLLADLTAAAAAAADARQHRDQLIVDARNAGATLRAIAAAAGLTHPGVLRILRAHD